MLVFSSAGVGKLVMSGFLAVAAVAQVSSLSVSLTVSSQQIYHYANYNYVYM